METMIPHSEERKRTLLDWVILGVVVAIALVVIALSFTNTAKLARELGLNEYLTAGLVEILFASLLFIRGRQRATRRNVPEFLTIGYFTSLGFVTGVNMYGLYQQSPLVGPIVGGAISAAMWLMESVLVWLWVDSHRPHQKKMKELKQEVRKEIEEIKLKQQLNWMLWEAQKPSLDLIKKARKAEEERKKATKDGIPIYFLFTRGAGTSDIDTNATKNIGEVITNTRGTEDGGTRDNNTTSGVGEVRRNTNPTKSTREAGDTGTSTVKVTSIKSATRKKNTTSTTKRKNTTRKINQNMIRHLRLVVDKKDDELAEIKKVALEIAERDGQLPGRPQLMAEANCIENRARRALKELKEQLEREEQEEETEAI